MAGTDDFDVEAMLEAPYKKEDEVSSKDHHDKDSKRRRSRSRDRRDRDKKRSRSKERRRSREPRDRRSRSRDRKRDNRRHRSRSRERRRPSPPPRDRRDRRGSRERRGGRRHDRGGSAEMNNGYMSIRKTEVLPELTPEERDARTVFCMQLAADIRPRDLQEFFTSVGKVRDVRLITDNKNRKSKGIAYVEFAEVESVPLGIGLCGQKLLGVPIVVQQSMAEKNRVGGTGQPAMGFKGVSGPMRLYVGSLHFNITEDMLRGIFEPFGKIDHINLVMDTDTQRSKGFGFVTFHNGEDAQKALQQLNGFELAGRPMKVGHVTERTADIQGQAMLDSDELDRAGVDLGATGRLALMAKLAEGTGFQIPQVAANALNMPGTVGAPPPTVGAPPIATQCFMLSNMFDPVTETNPNWENEIRDDVIEECNKHGGVQHIYVDKASPQGNVYVKCPSIASAVASVGALHGRWFAGKMITAAYVPLPNYHSLFPDAQRAVHLVMPTSRAINGAQPAMAGVM